MSLYREAGGGGRQGLIAGAIALVIGLGAGYLLGNASTDEPSFEEAVVALRTDLAPVSNGLDLLAVEYPQGVKNGEIAAQTEYGGSVSNVQRIADVLAAHSTELDQLDPQAAGALTKTVGALQEAIDSQAAPEEVDRLLKQATSEFEDILPPPSD